MAGEGGSGSEGKGSGSCGADHGGAGRVGREAVAEERDAAALELRGEAAARVRAGARRVEVLLAPPRPVEKRRAYLRARNGTDQGRGE